MSLKTYRQKRRFDRTAEPAGKPARTKPPADPTRRAFVIQKHDASHLHYDFRLELGGALKSWAVPKGPSTDPADKRLAVQVEDHPVEYATFEGTIPQGEYGGGTVMVWDRGTWTAVFPADPAKGLRDGKLEFDLDGEKLKGRWILVRMKARKASDKPQWLLRRVETGKDLSKTHELSVKTGRTMDEIAAGTAGRRRASTSKAAPSKTTRKPTKQARTPRSALDKLPEGTAKSPMPSSLEPQLATLVGSAPRGPEWIHEVKFDGYRMLAFCGGTAVRLISRNQKDWTTRFRVIADALESWKLHETILDGEIVAVDGQGRTSFQSLQAALKSGGAGLAYYVFDLPYYRGHDLRSCTLRDRREVLARLLKDNPDPALRFSDAIEGHGRDVQKEACRLALEGIISKRIDSLYTAGRGTDWVKSKCTSRQEMVIGGYTDPRRSRTAFGALLLGYFDLGQFRYAGRVGTGFSETLLTDLLKRLKRLEQPKPAFVDPPRGAQAAGVHWVRPEAVCEVDFTEWTKDGALRHPAFVELREDKDATQVVREHRTSTHEIESGIKLTPAARPPAKPAPARRAAPHKVSRKTTTGTPKRAGDHTVLGIEITHPDRVLFPDTGLTKIELAGYYAIAGEIMLKELAGRPISVVRCPRGSSQTCFYQKNWEGRDTIGSHIRTIALSNASISALVIDDVPGLAWMVQNGVLEIHTWGCREDDLERPDRMVFDLDPAPEVAWKDVKLAAKRLRDMLTQLKLAPVVKTTGGKGIHLVVPLKPNAGWDDVKAFSKSIADEMVASYPGSYIATMSKAKRAGLIFIDYLRNNRGATYVAPFSVRNRPGATVSLPISWERLERSVKRPETNIKEAMELASQATKAGNYPWTDLKPRPLPPIRK